MPIGSVPPPTQHPDEAPLICIPVNEQWIPILLGALQPLKYPEYWSGTLEENRGARKDFGILLDQIMQGVNCMAIPCCEDTIYLRRINPETGRFERSSDGGATWSPSPDDPMHIVRQLPPRSVPEGEDAKCNAATGFGENFNDIITAQSENLGTATTVLELAAAVAAVILDIIIAIVTEGIGAAAAIAITDAIFAAAVAAFTEGKTAFDDYWTSENKDKILCAAYCTIGDNGQFTQEQWDNFRHKVRLDLPPGAALDFALTAANSAGFVGASNMASYGVVADADCSECDCDGACDISGWEVWSGYGTINEGTRTSTFVEITAPNVGGQYHVIFISPDVDECCDIGAQADSSGQIYVSSGAASSSSYCPCGSDNTIFDTNWLSLGFGSVSMNGVHFGSLVPFTLTIDTTRT